MIFTSWWTKMRECRRSHAPAAAIVAGGLTLALSGCGPSDRAEWFREGKFGLLIHWGVSAIPGEGAWAQHDGAMPAAEYAKLREQFQPDHFDPHGWVKLASEAGARYLVLGAKHHDGFCLFDSEHTDFDVAATPFRRDVVREVSRACRRVDLPLGLSYSIMDWHHPDYLPRRSWEANTRPADQADFGRYVDYMYSQIQELLDNYGPVAMLAFDGGWEHPDPADIHAGELHDLAHRLQPKALLNDRANLPADIAVMEQTVPSRSPRLPDGTPALWESWMTITSGRWGYDRTETNFKTAPRIVQTLVDVASKGGNLLLEVGPRPDGTFQLEVQDRLGEVGRWLKENGESVYGTLPSPFRAPPAGVRCTLAQPRGNKPGKLFVHVFDWEDLRPIVLEGLKCKIVDVYRINDPPYYKRQGDAVMYEYHSDRLTLRRNKPNADPCDSVVVVEYKGELQVDNALRPGPGGVIVCEPGDTACRGERVAWEWSGGRNHIGQWTRTDDWVEWDLALPTAGRYDVFLTASCPEESTGGEYLLRIAADETVSGRVEPTRNWDAFARVRVGSMTLKPGPQRLELRARSIPRDELMRLKLLELVPVGP